MIYEISRIGQSKDYIKKINNNFEQSPSISGVLMETIDDNNTMELICEKLNNNFSEYNTTGLYSGLNYNLYAQMEIDHFFKIINTNFKIINPTEDLILA
jgi:hypothetical protein